MNIKQYSIRKAIFVILLTYSVCFGLFVLAETKSNHRPDLSYQIVYQTEKGFDLEVLEADSIYEAIQIFDKVHPNTEIVSVNRRSFVVCNEIPQK